MGKKYWESVLFLLSMKGLGMGLTRCNGSGGHWSMKVGSWALIRTLQKDVIHSKWHKKDARLRNFFSKLSSQYIQPTQLFFYVWCPSSTPWVITGRGKGTSHCLVTERKRIHNQGKWCPSSQEDSELMSFGVGTIYQVADCVVDCKKKSKIVHVFQQVILVVQR